MHANYNLGYLFELGAGVAKQPALALIAYDNAALQGIAKAQHRLAPLLLTYCRSDPEANCRPIGHDPEQEALPSFSGELHRTPATHRVLG
jgi:TPR repeat protein